MYILLLDFNKLLEKNSFVKVRDRSCCSQELLGDENNGNEEVEAGTASKTPKGVIRVILGTSRDVWGSQ